MAMFSGKNGRNASVWGADRLREGYEGQRTALENGNNIANSLYQQQADMWKPMAEDGGRYSTMYGNGMGLNGAAGNQAATQAFQAGPGYQFAMSQGLDALDRRAASRGMLGSGNNTLDTLNYSQGLANQEYQNWLKGLMSGAQFGQNAMQQQSGALGRQAESNWRFASDMGKSMVDQSKGVSDIGMSGFKAGDQASANRFGAIMGGLNLGAQLLGAGSGGSSGGSGSGGGAPLNLMSFMKPLFAGA